MPRILVKLTYDELAGLVKLASRESRDPREQLRVILRTALEKQEVAPDPSPGLGQPSASSEQQPLDEAEE